MGYTLALMLVAVLLLLFTVPTKALDTGQVIKEQTATVHPTAAAPTEYAVIDGTEAPTPTPLANRYSPGVISDQYKTQFNKALEAKPVKSDYGI